MGVIPKKIAVDSDITNDVGCDIDRIDFNARFCFKNYEFIKSKMQNEKF